MLQAILGQEKRIAAGDDDIAHSGSPGDVGQGPIYLGAVHLPELRPHQAAAGAVTTIAGTLIGHYQEDPVGVTVYQAGHRGLGIFVQRVGQIIGRFLQLVNGGYHLTPQGAVWISGVYQGGKIGGDSHAHPVGSQDALFFIRSELQ